MTGSLPPLRWRAEEDLIYDPESNTLHRAECPRVGDLDAAWSVQARSSLELIWAPALCECGPDVTLGLGADHSARLRPLRQAADGTDLAVPTPPLGVNHSRR